MNHFNQLANSWDTPEKIELSAHYAKEISFFLHEEKLKILEVGCGTGLLGSQFVKNENQLVGVDTSLGMLEIFNKKFDGIPYVKSYFCNLENEKLDEDNFNLVLSSMAFHHLVNPLEMVRKLKDFTQEDGFICIIDLDKEDGSFHPDPAKMGVHHFGFSKEQVASWGKLTGLHLLAYKVIHNISKNDKSYPIFLVVFKKIKEGSYE
jgi:ubiquinone/menaquinone biosynthesis C-methylase UbiE